MEKLNDLMLRLMARWEAKKGQGMVEYALILALVSVVAIGVLQLVGTSVKNVFSSAAAALAAA